LSQVDLCPTENTTGYGNINHVTKIV